VGTRSSDFNYKVALASGLKSLQAGRIRQAEEQFRYLLTHFPAADGGYRGLAKVLIEQEDRPSALRMLLDGGAAVAKAGQRASAIGLYRDATALEPSDLTAHRRLAAALTLAGDQSAATQEYVRYIQAALFSGARDRARAEVQFALERVSDSDELVNIARSLGVEVVAPPPRARPPAATSAAPAPTAPHTPPPPPAAPPVERVRRGDAEDRAALMRSAFGGAPTRSESAPSPQPAPREAPATPEPPHVSQMREPAAAEMEAPPVEPEARSASSSDPWAGVDRESVSDPQAVTLGATDGESRVTDADSQAVEADAAHYLAKHDPRGGVAALEAARRYIADGRNDAASDLLLQLIASGVADHDAQRLLVDVVRTLGKRDVAKAKCLLLVQALRLDGRDDLAAEVEQLALAD
jgi:thioredoxin-like negative regulator of GroEL